MGIKGLYSYLKNFSETVHLENHKNKRIGIDAYAFMYKYQDNLIALENVIDAFMKNGNKLYVYVDGRPPIEKQEELLDRKEKRNHAALEAHALRSFLSISENRSSLTPENIDHLEMKIKALEKTSWRVTKDSLQGFLNICSERGLSIHRCASEADFDLITAARQHELDIVISNDMDLFVGGVPYLWILGKTPQEPLFRQFRFRTICEACGIHPKAWADVALLAGYEKTKALKRCSVEQAVTWIRYYGCLENLFERQKELLGEATLADFQAARKWLQV